MPSQRWRWPDRRTHAEMRCRSVGDKVTRTLPICQSYEIHYLNEVFVREVFKFKLACDVLVDQLIDFSQDSQVPSRAKVLSCKGGWTLTG